MSGLADDEVEHGSAGAPAASGVRPAARRRLVVVGAVALLLVGAGALAVWQPERRAPAAPPPQAIAALQEVEKALDRGDWSGARHQLKVIQRAGQGEDEAALGLEVVSLISTGPQWDTRRFFDAFEAQQTRSAELGGLFHAHLESARAGWWLADGELDRAAADYGRVLAARPAAVEALLGLGTVARLRGNLGRALSHYSKARKVVPEHPAVLSALAFTLARKGDLKRARKLYEEVLERDPEFVAAYLELARVQRESGDAAGALATLVRLLEDVDALMTLPKNGRPLGYRVSARVAKEAHVMRDAPVIFLRGSLHTRYYYRLSLAFSACLAEDVATMKRALIEAQAVLKGRLPLKHALNAQWLLTEEVNDETGTCLYQVAEPLRMPSPHGRRAGLE